MSGTTSGTISSSSVSSLGSAGNYNPVDDPFYVSHNEITGSSLVKLKKAIEIALSARLKLDFVLGRHSRPGDDDPMLAKWQRCNDVVMSWLINSVSKQIVGQILHADDVAAAWQTLHVRYVGSNLSRKFSLKKDICNLLQGDMDIASYFDKLTNYWEELDAMRGRRSSVLGKNCVECRENLKERMEDRTMQFLFGLNEIHSQVGTHILALQELPHIDVIYDMVSSHEVEYNLTKAPAIEASAMYAQQNSFVRQQNRAPASPSTYRQKLYCTHCKMNGHNKETCYKIIGYPLGHRLYKSPVKQDHSNSRNGQRGRVAANVILNETTRKKPPNHAAEPNAGGMQFTEAQFNKILDMIGKRDDNCDGNEDHMAGNEPQNFPEDW
ncbi:unnamed protein product [Rhodiola kirilowii]